MNIIFGFLQRRFVTSLDFVTTEGIDLILVELEPLWIPAILVGAETCVLHTLNAILEKQSS